MATWTTKSIDRAGTITMGLDGTKPTKVFFSGEALDDASEEGVRTVSDETASFALAEVQRITGARMRFVGWHEEGDAVVGRLATV